MKPPKISLSAIPPAPKWLEENQENSRRKGTDKMTMEEIDAIIAEVRDERRERQKKQEKA